MLGRCFNCRKEGSDTPTSEPTSKENTAILREVVVSVRVCVCVCVCVCTCVCVVGVEMSLCDAYMCWGEGDPSET